MKKKTEVLCALQGVYGVQGSPFLYTYGFWWGGGHGALQGQQSTLKSFSSTTRSSLLPTKRGCITASEEKYASHIVRLAIPSFCM